MGATRTNFHRRCSPLSSLLPAFHFSLPRCTVLGRSHSFMGASNGSSRAGNISSNVTMAFDPRNRPAPTLRDRNLRGTIGAPFERRLLHSRSSPFIWLHISAAAFHRPACCFASGTNIRSVEGTRIPRVRNRIIHRPQRLSRRRIQMSRCLWVRRRESQPRSRARLPISFFLS